MKSGIDAQTAWTISTGSPSVVVAVVDTGVRYEHPDLLSVDVGGHLLPGYDMISDAGVANDGDGRDADASDPGDWITDAEAAQSGGPFEDCDVEDSSWHGTQVSGLIGALTDNGLGMASVAPQRAHPAGARARQVRRLRLGHHRRRCAGRPGSRCRATPANPTPAQRAST